MRRGEQGGDGITWTSAERLRLSQSIRENGVDDWNTLGDWSKVTQSQPVESVRRRFCRVPVLTQTKSSPSRTRQPSPLSLFGGICLLCHDPSAPDPETIRAIPGSNESFLEYCFRRADEDYSRRPIQCSLLLCARVRRPNRGYGQDRQSRVLRSAPKIHSLASSVYLLRARFATVAVDATEPTAVGCGWRKTRDAMLLLLLPR